MENTANKKSTIVLLVLVLLSFIPVLGVLFLGIFASKALRVPDRRRKIILLILALFLLGQNINNSIGVYRVIHNMPPLDGMDANHIKSQVKADLTEHYQCPEDQIDSFNLTGVNVNSSGQVTYHGTAYACHKVYQVEGTCQDKTDQHCALHFIEIDSK